MESNKLHHANSNTIYFETYTIEEASSQGQVKLTIRIVTMLTNYFILSEI
jgi:hypothetical protein